MAVPPIGGVAAAVPAVSVAAAVDAADADGAVVAPVADAGDVAVGLADRVEKMRAELDMPRSTVSDNLAGGPKTRWQELQQTLRLLATMLLVIEHMDGFWLKFLNDAEWYKITSTAQLEEIFAGKPRARGKTPLLGNLAPVIEGFGRDDRDTLLLILTDGEPSDCEFDELSHLIKSKPDDVFCSFAMCTDEADVVELYNKVVDPIFGCDITDDYAAECREAKRVGNALSPFQWLAKMLLVKYDKYDALDERKLDGRRRACCALS
ncbi:hypothetical protein JL720_5311 [Aureococcus anophagefferens]|nr:hypothetical protein JL720_5311 [Aureococcus anophagefferens]